MIFVDKVHYTNQKKGKNIKVESTKLLNILLLDILSYY